MSVFVAPKLHFHFSYRSDFSGVLTSFLGFLSRFSPFYFFFQYLCILYVVDLFKEQDLLCC